MTRVVSIILAAASMLVLDFLVYGRASALYMLAHALQ